jgi:hypothetical protein
MQDARHIRQVLPPGTAHLLPVMDRGGTGCYPALGLGDLGRVCLDVLLSFLEALLGLFQLPFGVPQTTKDAQRIALGQIMAHVK